VEDSIFFSMKYISDALLSYGIKMESRKIGQLLRRLHFHVAPKRVSGNLINLWDKPLGLKK